MARPDTAQPVNTTLRKIAVVVATAVSGMSVYAQAATTPKEETITVTSAAPQESAWGPAATIAAKHTATATKTDTPLEKTPQSVSVVTRDEMDMKQPGTVKDALSYTPSVFATRGSSTTYDVVTIRGFTTSTTVNTNQYLDGMKLQGNNYSEISMDPYFLERVELMRGPVSVLYGQSNPGGVVSMVTKRPQTTPLREVQFKMGTDNLWQTGFDFSDAIDDNGVWSYRLTGLGRSQDTQQQMAKSTRYAVAPSFSWRPDDKTDFTFLSNFQNDPNAGYYGWLPREGTIVPFYDANGNAQKLPTDFNEGERDNKMSRRHQMVGYSFSHAFNDTFTVRQNLRYARIHTLYRSVYGDGYSSTVPGQINRAFVRSDEDLNTFTVDNQLESKFATGAVDHTLLTGVDYMRMRNDIDADYGSANPINALDPQYGNANVKITFPYAVINRQEQTGLYVQDQAEWDKWVLTLGGRYDFAKTSTFTRSTSSLAEINDQQFTWRGGLNYLFDNGIAPYFSYSESFEPVSGSSASGQPFDPSRGKQYEAGVKYVPKDMPVVVTAAAFQLTKDKNLTADPNNTLFSTQGGEIRARGIELEAKAALTANIDVTAAYSYTDSKYTHDTVFEGKRPAEVPRNLASFWADYTFHETALSGLTIGAGARYVGSTSSIYSNRTTRENELFSVAGYTVADAAIKYDLARFGLPGSSVGVNVNNLFDREYVSSCYREYACYWGAERQVVATATFRF
ncbi:Ferrichrome iron receptor [Kosakonia sp. BK9b]